MSEREGVLVVDKTSGPTSHDVVAGVRRILNMRRVGHCGTLDPLATGILVICLGAYTRLSDWLSRGEKEYESVFFLGARSDTGDSQGKIEASTQDMPDLGVIRAALRRFEGRIDQVPPAFSAVKVDGVRSYRLARQQQAVTLEARQVEIGPIEILEYQPPRLRVRIVCSRGTYIRSLAVDLGEALGCGAYVDALRRLRVGTMGLARAITLEQLRQVSEEGRTEEVLMPVQEALSQLPNLELNAAELQVFINGGRVRLSEPQLEGGEYAVYGSEGRLWGIGAWTAGQFYPLRVFVPQTVLAETGSGG